MSEKTYTYTKSLSETSSNIYFLNDKNFVDSIHDTTVSNGIPSLNLISTEINNRNAIIGSVSTDLSLAISATNNTIENLSVEFVGDHQILSNAIDNKIVEYFGDNNETQVEISSLAIHKISWEKYSQLVASKQIVSTDLYVVSSSSINAYGNTIANVADGIVSTDAINLKQLVDVSNSVSSRIDSLSNTTQLCIGLGIVEAETSSKNYVERRLYDVSSSLTSDAKAISSFIMQEVDGISTDVYGTISNDLYVQPKFVSKAGDSIACLSVENGISSSAFTVKTPSFITSHGDVGIGIVAEDKDSKPLQIWSNHSGINLKVENGINNVTVASKDGTQSLSTIVKQSIDARGLEAELSSKAYTDEKISQLSPGAFDVSVGKKVSKITQKNGMVNVTCTNIVADDIPMLPTDKIVNITNEFYTATSADNVFVKKEKIELKYDDSRSNPQIYLLIDGIAKSSIDASSFVKDGFLNRVVYSKDEYTDSNGLVLKGPHIIFEWNTDAGINTTPIALSSLVCPYNAKGDGLVLDKDNNFSIDYGVVAKLSDLTATSSNLMDLSNDNIANIYFAGHMSLNDNYEFLSDAVAHHVKHGYQTPSTSKVKNNSAFNVTIDKDDVSCSIQGVDLYTGDLAIVHRDGHDDQYEIDIGSISPNDIVVVHGGVTQTDIFNLNKKIDDVSAAANVDFVNVSGDSMYGTLTIGNEQTSADGKTMLNVLGPTEMYHDLSILNDHQIYVDQINANAFLGDYVWTNDAYLKNDVYINSEYARNIIDTYKKYSNMLGATARPTTDSSGTENYVSLLSVIQALSGNITHNYLSTINQASSIVNYNIESKVFLNQTGSDNVDSYISVVTLSVANISSTLYDEIYDNKESAFLPSVVYVPTDIATRAFVDKTISSSFEISIDNMLANVEKSSCISDIISAVCELRDVISCLVLHNNGTIVNIDK